MAQEESAKLVKTKPFHEVAIFPSRSAPATAVSLNNAQISAEIAGLIKEIPVRVGDNVGEGELLVRIDCTDYTIKKMEAQAALKSAEAHEKFGRQQLQNARRLAKKNSISEEEIDKRESEAAARAAEVMRLRAVVNSSAQMIEKCQVKAPFSAVVIERSASVGELASVGTKLVRLLDKNNIEVAASVQGDDLDSLETAVEIAFVTLNDSYPLRVRTTLPMMDSKIRSYEVRLSFKEDPAPPGSAGRLEWVNNEAHLPPHLLVRRDESLGAFIYMDGKARFIPLPDAREGRLARVTLDPQTQIVIEGRTNLQDGDFIELGSL